MRLLSCKSLIKRNDHPIIVTLDFELHMCINISMHMHAHVRILLGSIGDFSYTFQKGKSTYTFAQVYILVKRGSGAEVQIPKKFQGLLQGTQTPWQQWTIISSPR